MLILFCEMWNHVQALITRPPLRRARRALIMERLAQGRHAYLSSLVITLVWARWSLPTTRHPSRPSTTARHTPHSSYTWSELSRHPSGIPAHPAAAKETPRNTLKKQKKRERKHSRGERRDVEGNGVAWERVCGRGCRFLQ